MVDDLADAVHSGCVYPALDYDEAKWYETMPGPPPAPVVPLTLPQGAHMAFPQPKNVRPGKSSK